MSLRTLSQNKFSNKRYNSSNTIYSKYWLATIGGASLTTVNGSRGSHIAVDSLGAIYVVSDSTLGSGNGDLCLTKFNTSGSVVWQKSLGYSATTESGNAICVDISNNIYVAAQRSSTNTNTLLGKYDSSGNLLWQTEILTASYNFIPYGVATSPDGSNVYVAGYYNLSATYMGYIVQFDSSGNSTYNRRFSNTSSGNTAFYAMTIDSSGNLYVTGAYAANTAQVVCKYDSTLTFQWARTLNTGLSGWSIHADPVSNYIYVLNQPGTTVNNSKTTLMKIDSSANVIWTVELSLGGLYTASIRTDYLGNIYVACWYNISPLNSYLLKYDSGGNLLWQRSMNSSSSVDRVTGLAVDVSGNPYLLINDGTTGNLFHLPSDGSLTGTYDGFTYASSSLTSSSISTTATTVTGYNSTLNSIVAAATAISQSTSYPTTTLTPIAY